MSLASRIPLFGELFSASPRSLSASFFELLVGTIFSTLPLWFFPVFVSFTIKDSPSFLSLVASSLSKGELYIYSAALIGPLVYAITKNYADYEKPTEEGRIVGRLQFEFPYGLWFFLASIFVCMLAAFFFSFTSLPVFQGKININSDFVFYLSVGVYIFSILCLYAVSVYRSELEHISKSLPQEERAFLAEWRHRK